MIDASVTSASAVNGVLNPSATDRETEDSSGGWPCVCPGMPSWSVFSCWLGVQSLFVRGCGGIGARDHLLLRSMTFHRDRHADASRFWGPLGWSAGGSPATSLLRLNTLPLEAQDSVELYEIKQVADYGVGACVGVVRVRGCVRGCVCLYVM